MWILYQEGRWRWKKKRKGSIERESFGTSKLRENRFFFGWWEEKELHKNKEGKKRFIRLIGLLDRFIF